MNFDNQLYSKWRKGLKRHRTLNRQYANSVSASHRLELQGYVEAGFFPDTTSSFASVKPVPAFQGWENTKLNTCNKTVSYGFHIDYYLEKIDGCNVSIANLGNSFLHAYISFLIEVYMLSLYERRFGFKSDSSALELSIPFIALGYLVGEDTRADRMAKLAIRGFHSEWMPYRKYPIFTFMLSLLADYLGEPPLEFLGIAVEAKSLQQLLMIWKDPDPECIKELCLLACDVHIHRCRNDSVKELFEFSNLPFYEWPIAINLLFKLREKLGLQNPELDHPLMNSPLGKLPEVTPFEYDPLLFQVIERMKSQGFDEDLVFEKVYYEK